MWNNIYTWLDERLDLNGRHLSDRLLYPLA